MTVLMMLPLCSAWADTEVFDDDAAFFEFLGSFESEDDEWLDVQMLDEDAGDDEVPATEETEDNR
jgi:hypothetical protein